MDKALIQNVVDTLPDQVDVDALIEKLYLLQKIEIGERQLASGAGISHADAKKRLGEWLD